MAKEEEVLSVTTLTQGRRGGNGSGLVYLQLDELTLKGKILAEGEIIKFKTFV